MYVTVRLNSSAIAWAPVGAAIQASKNIAGGAPRELPLLRHVS